MFGRQHPPQAAPRHAPPPQSHMRQGPPAGTFVPGTKIQVGSHRIVIEKYLSEGGFAHVYLVKLPKPIDGTDIAVLKRVAVPDKESLRGMRIEVETMKRLKGHRPIVKYIDSHASEMKSGGYEVFLLMEYCNGGGLIDFMNTRLQHRLTEPEILQIITDIAEGVACMHYLKPPLLHRDLKVENVLITKRGTIKRFKLCDFGSAAPPRPAPTNVAECRRMDEDVQKHTTLQYRSPEMIDVYRKQPLNEKADIWALGVLLYKLCYYTTPFEEQGSLAILNASYRFPHHPVFTERLQRLIASMLREKLDERPNIYQVLKEVCAMQRLEVPIQDIYSGRSNSAAKSPPNEPSKPTTSSVGATLSAPVQEKQQLPDITPMRRGRPPASPSRGKTASQPDLNKRVTEGDPFAALDSKAVRKANQDELSTRFPSLNEFSLLHDKDSKFNFETPGSPPSKLPDYNTTQKLPDTAPKPQRITPVLDRVASQRISANPSPTTSISKPLPAAPLADEAQPRPVRPSVHVPQQNSASKYVSTGTMTSEPAQRKLPALQGQDSLRNGAQSVATPPLPVSIRPNAPASPDLISLPASASRPRPMSTTLDARQVNISANRMSAVLPQSQISKVSSRNEGSYQSTIKPPGDVLSKECSKYDGTKDAGQSDHKPDISLRAEVADAGYQPRNLTQGRFGDTFKRFEQNNGSDPTVESRSSSPSKQQARDDLLAINSPIDGPEATNYAAEQDEEAMTPEQRRDFERLQLEQEERRVAAAQAEYRNRVAQEGKTGRPAPGPKPSLPLKSAAIQSRVQAYLNDDQRQTSAPKTAEGYGKYSDAATAASRVQKSRPEIRRKPLLNSSGVARTNSLPPSRAPDLASSAKPTATGTHSVPSSGASKPPVKPPPPKKPVYLNNLPAERDAALPPKREKSSVDEQLIALDLPGQPALDMTLQEREDYLEDFSKRFPSLSAIEGSGR